MVKVVQPDRAAPAGSVREPNWNWAKLQLHPRLAVAAILTEGVLSEVVGSGVPERSGVWVLHRAIE